MKTHFLKMIIHHHFILQGILTEKRAQAQQNRLHGKASGQLSPQALFQMFTFCQALKKSKKKLNLLVLKNCSFHQIKYHHQHQHIGRHHLNHRY
jgi:hypothetical protein